MLVAGLALLVFLLGAFILVLKLKPVSVPGSQVNARVVVWEQEVKRNGDDSWNWTGLGLAYLGANRSDDASEAFEKALELDEDNWLANFQYGLLLRDSDTEEAKKYLTQASQLAPPESSVAVFTALGDQLYSEGDYKKARVAYAKAIAILPGVFEARMGLGRSLQALGENRYALEQYRKALQLNPGSGEAREAIDNYRDELGATPSPAPNPGTGDST